MRRGYLDPALAQRSLASPIQTVSGTSATLNSSQRVVFCSNASDLVLALPAAASSAGLEFTIMKTGAGTALVTIDPNSTETINGASTLVLYVLYDTVTIVCDGAAWYISEDGRIAHTCRLRRAVAQSIGNSSPVKILFDASDFDVGGIGDIVTNDRVNIRRAGRYTITASGFVSGSPTVHILYVYQQGAAVLQAAVTGGAGFSAALCVADKLQCAANDTIEMYLFQTSGGALNTSTAADGQPRLTVSEDL